MEKKRMMEHGAVQEEISLRIEYDIHKCEDSLRTEGKITKEVSLGWNNILCGRGMSIGDILDFQEKANALLQKVKALLADGTYVKVSVTKAAYENVRSLISSGPICVPSISFSLNAGILQITRLTAIRKRRGLGCTCSQTPDIPMQPGT